LQAAGSPDQYQEGDWGVAEMNVDLYEMLESICPRFKDIPTSEKDVISRHMAGLGAEVISAQTGRSVRSVTDAVDRYSSLVARVPDTMRIKLARVMLVNSMSSYAAAASDRDKIAKLSASEAIKSLMDMKKLLPEMMEMEIRLLEHDNKVKSLSGDAMDMFAKSLEDGK